MKKPKRKAVRLARGIDGPALLYDTKAIRAALIEARKLHTKKVNYARGLDGH